MSNYDPIEYPSSNRGEFEVSKDALPAEEQCLVALFDMADVDKIGAYQSCDEFYSALNGWQAPADLKTNIHPRRVLANEGGFMSQTFPKGIDVIATVAVGFRSESENLIGLRNLDFVQTEDGLKVFEKNWFIEEGERVPKYVRTLDDNQLKALTTDAEKITQTIIDIDTERLKLGPLVEEAGPDGLRRFHVGDILSVATGKLVSARGVTGLYDLLGYMTDDAPHTTQLGRFADECGPLLREQFGEKLKDFFEPPQEALVNVVSAYRWLGEVIETIGDPFLTVRPIHEDQHARIDPQTELVLDYGDDIEKKIITCDPEKPDEQ